MGQISEKSAGITIFCDLHGHNRKQNCFFFGCNKAPNEGLLSWTKTRLLPKIFASNEKIFDMISSRFNQSQSKYNTARVVVWNEFQVTNSFTLETSMFGKQTVNEDDLNQFINEDFASIGMNLLKSVLQFVNIETQLMKELKSSRGWLKKRMLDEFTGLTAR